MKKKILIVDDLSANRSILYTILSEEYEVLEASDGEIALDMIFNTPFGNSIVAVVLDLMMPVMDGFEFLKRLSETDKFKNYQY